MIDLSSLLEKIDSLRAELNSLKPLKQVDEERLWKKFRLEWNFNSNHIEGNTLTYGQTELLLIFDKTTGDHEMREYEEMKAHDVAIKLIQGYAKDFSRTLTEADVRELNKIILVRPYWGNAQTPDGQPTRKEIIPGEYKKQPNSVRLQNGEMFHYASPEETPAKMAELMEWYRKAESKKKFHPLQLAAKIHYDFVRIHPFDDSNGRTSRLLMNYVLLRHGFPPVIIKSADKKNYLTALNKADVGDLDSFVEYIAKELFWSLEISIKAAKGESIEEVDDIDKELSVWKKKFSSKAKGIPKSLEIIETTFFNGLAEILQKAALKCMQFKDMFAVSRVYFDYSSLKDFYKQKKQNYLGTEVEAANIGEYVNKIYLRNLNEEYSSLSIRKRFYDQPDFVKLLFVFEGLESKTGNFIHVEFSVVVNFNKFEYSVFLDRTSVVSRKYSSDTIGIQEQDEIVSKLTRLAFDFVKSKVG